ncbi:MAG: DEAD/DEAH box helicase [Legionellaceae bacterium]|nr:DEAD/DEAH box helicase [Legionellaceae bacterium]
MNEAPVSFADLKLAPALLSALESMQFVTPSPVQAQTIPLMLAGQDVIAKAQTGTGKTAAFALPALQNIDIQARYPQVLVLAPTRELAIQVAAQFSLLAKDIPAIRVSVLCGGQDYRRQLKELQDGAQIIVGTPGRILDHIERKTLLLDKLRTFVLDEADEMLRMGFIEDVETILAQLPDNKQMALFSATMPSRIRQIAQRYLTDAQSVEIRSETATVKAVEQRFLFASQHQKPNALARILAVEDYQGVIIFVRTKSSTEEVANLLQQQGHRAMAIHGDITQSLRERIIAQFKQGAIDILVATDVAARGLDVERVTHVINYDVPQDCETYVHRIGRTGRAGRSGVTVLFVTQRETRLLSMIERHTRQSIEKIQIPNDHQISQVRERLLFQKIQERLADDKRRSYTKVLARLMSEQELDPMELASALALMLHQDKSWQESVTLPPAEISRDDKRERGGKERDRNGRGREFTGRDRERSPKVRDGQSRERNFNDKLNYADSKQEQFRIDVGRIHGVKPGNLVGALANEGGLQSRQISALKIHDSYSTVCLPENLPKQVVQNMAKAWVCGRQLSLTPLAASAHK